jgi:hypothetical protein
MIRANWYIRPIIVYPIKFSVISQSGINIPAKIGAIYECPSSIVSIIKKRWYSMKRTNPAKALASACLALTLLLGSNLFAFATSAPTESSAAETIVVTAAEVSGATSEASEAATNADGTINASPNTGTAFPPMAAALLAIAAVPVIFVASRKKVSDRG